MSRFSFRTLLLAAAGMALAVFFFAPQSAHAIWPFDKLIESASYSFVGALMWWISSILTGILGIFVAIAAWGVQLMLQISQGISNSPPVQFGVPVTTYLANLGFVLAIVVMAIMTILRRESFGMKQMMAKLIFAAILVNFSLIISSTILNTSDRLTNAFMDGVSPMGTRDGTASGDTHFASFGSAIASAFNPQRYFTVAPDTTSNVTQRATAQLLPLAPLAGLLFSLVGVILIVITLCALVIMLLVRYVAIAILMILMPLAWAAWVFPSLSKYFNQWWGEFLKQVFFAPVIVFFIWLAIKTGEGINAGGSPTVVAFEGDYWFSSILGNILSPLVQQFLNSIVVCGILIGGLFAAKKIGATGSAAALNFSQAVGKGAGEIAMRRTARSATPGYQPPPAKTRVGKLWQAAGGKIGWRGLSQRVTKRLPGGVKGAIATYGAEKPSTLGRVVMDSIGKESGLWKPGKHEVKSGDTDAVLKTIARMEGKNYDTLSDPEKELIKSEAIKKYKIKFAKNKITLPKDPQEREEFLKKAGFDNEDAARASGLFDWSEVDKTEKGKEKNVEEEIRERLKENASRAPQEEG